MTVRDVAARLRVCKATVYRLCESGLLPHIRISNSIRIAAGNSNLGTPLNVAATLAANGLAMISIDLPGHGFGPNSTLTIQRTAANGGNVTIAFGGRGVDLNGNGTIAAGEGSSVLPPKQMVNNRPAFRQAVADLVRLVRVIEAGVHFDENDGVAVLDARRIYAAGQSMGGNVGVLLTAVEPAVRAGFFASIAGWQQPWLSPGASRGAVGTFLGNRSPSLLNPLGAPLITSLGGVAVNAPFFNENIPARDSAPLVNTVAGALAIQNELERSEWEANLSVPGAFAPYLRLSPLEGVGVRRIIIGESRGDQTQSNPDTAEFARAGLLGDRFMLYRHDLNPNRNAQKNPHTMISNTAIAAFGNVVTAYQNTMATFFASDGTSFIDGDGSGVLFEAPAGAVPEDFGFIQ